MSKIRFGGLATGLDTDSMIKQLMAAERMKVDKVSQDKQLIQWRQDLYREIIGDFNIFRSTFFDVLKTDTNMLSRNNYVGLDAASSDNLIAKADVLAGAIPGRYNVKVNTLAQPAKIEGSPLTAEPRPTTSTKLSDLGIANGTITLTYNGTSKDIIVDNTKTVGQLITQISSATTGNVNARFSELTGKFSIQTQNTGVNSSLKIIGDVPNLLGIDLANSPLGLETTGSNADIAITPPGGTAVTVSRETNNFIIDGMRYNITDIGETTINVTANTQKVFDKVTSFVDKYNEIVDKVNEKISEKKQYSFKPLTDEQRKEMSEDEIKRWEERAKEGLFKNDSMLQNMLTSMRMAFSQAVEGAGVSLKEIGLDTSSDYTQKGKIIINETKLKSAIQNRGDQVINIFTKVSTSHASYSPDLTSGERSVRNKEQGILQRINDILQDYVRTTRNSGGKKGILLEKAGVKGDFTEVNNLLSEELKQKDKVMIELNRKLAERENTYYRQFAQLEKAMQRMNEQSNWLSQQLGTMYS